MISKNYEREWFLPLLQNDIIININIKITIASADEESKVTSIPSIHLDIAEFKDYM